MVAFLHKTDATPPLLRKSVLANVTLSFVFIFFSALQTKHADNKATQNLTTKVHVFVNLLPPPKKRELFIIIITIISVFLEHSQTHYHHLMMIDKVHLHNPHQNGGAVTSSEIPTVSRSPAESWEYDGLKVGGAQSAHAET